MRGLLDITDNLRRRQASCRRADVVRHDGDDPYLVVAADKGTATFSDIANGVAARVRLLARRRLRLGRLGRLRPQEDGHHRRAAPGNAVKRHFRELGTRHPDRRTSPCVGVGDMSGDVFGNGMLLSRAHQAARPPSTTCTSSSIPIPTRRRASPSASGCSTCRARPGPTTTRQLISQGRRRLRPQRQVDPALAPRSQALLRHRPQDASTPGRADPRAC